jgi:hypothetical protein
MINSNKASLTDICIFTRTYSNDKFFLPYLYRSIEKYASNWGEVILVVPTNEINHIKEYVPDWVRIIKENQFTNGQIQHKYTKLMADMYTEKKYIFHIDSDSIFTKKVTINDLMEDEKPYLEYSSYEHLYEEQNKKENIEIFKKYCLENVVRKDFKFTNEELKKWILSEFELWFEKYYSDWKENYGVDIWRKGTEFAMQMPIEFEFSRRPEKLYPRNLYHMARSIIEQKHGLNLENFIKTRVGRQSEGVKKENYFSDLNFMGAVLYYYLKDEIKWINIEVDGYEFRKTFVKQFISYDCLTDSGINEKTVNEIEDYLNC